MSFSWVVFYPLRPQCYEIRGISSPQQGLRKNGEVISVPNLTHGVYKGFVTMQPLSFLSTKPEHHSLLLYSLYSTNLCSFQNIFLFPPQKSKAFSLLPNFPPSPQNANFPPSPQNVVTSLTRIDQQPISNLSLSYMHLSQTLNFHPTF